MLHNSKTLRNICSYLLMFLHFCKVVWFFAEFVLIPKTTC